MTPGERVGRSSAAAGWSAREQNASRLEALLDVTETGQWEWDFASGRIAWSAGLGPLHARPRGWEPASYEEFRELIHPDDWPAVDAAAGRARAEGVGYELEFRVVVPGGGVRWLWTRAEVVRHGEGEGRLVGVTRDVTERRRRDDAERFIAAASQLLLATTSADEALMRLCELAAEELTDWCLVQQVAASVPADVLAVAHRDPALAAVVHAFHERASLVPAGDDPRQLVIDTGQSVTASSLEIGGEVIAPVLSAGGEVRALLVLGNLPEHRALDEQDTAVAEALGRRTAVALERLRLLEAERRSALRTEALQRVTAQLSAAATAEDVLRVAIEDGLATMGASGGSIAYPERGTARMRRVTAGYAPEDAEGPWASVPFDADLPGPEAARTGMPLWLDDREGAERRFPLLAEVFAHTPWTSLCALALPAGSRNGFFVAFFAGERTFDAEDRAFTVAIVTLCAQALERARLLDEAARAHGVADRLQAVTAALSAAATPDDVGAAAVGAGMDAIGADGVLVYVREEAAARLVASAGYDTETTAGWTLIPAGTDVPAMHVLERGETIVFASPDEAMERYPLIAGIRARRGARPSVLAPMAVGDATLGVLCTSFGVQHVIEDEDVAFVQSIARLCAQALERARLLEAERVTSERLARLQAVTALLGSALTVDEVARIVVHEGVAALGGAAGALVLDRSDESLETVRAIGYSDELLDLYRRFLPTDPVVAARVYTKGTPYWVESLEEMEAAYPHEERALDPHLQAEAYVPLLVAGSPIGVLLVSFDGPRQLSEDERELLLTLARQSAQALANARAFEREHRIAEGLQRALLPESLVVPGSVTTAVRYLSGSTEADVGGDWYDVASRPDGRVGGSVGDVAGKGVLAASRMGQLRTAQRAHSLEGLSPAAVVARLNALVEATGSFLATVVAFDLDPETGELRYCVAGHLPPLVLRPDGECVFLRGAGSLPVGVDAQTPFAEEAVVLGPRDVALFYTDGLVERRDQGLETGLTLLIDAVRANDGATLDALVDSVLDRLVELEGLRDDVVLLALQRAAG
jgi:serine phosphatase RsbU (regulator of sigma subunit)